MSTTSRILASLTPLALLAACDPGSHALPSAPGNGITAMMFSTEGTPWSAPVNLGATINSAANEQNATLSPDGLALYFTSSRADGAGPLDIWVAHRECTDLADAACAWQTPGNLGSVINTPGADFAPNLSLDGHLLFFASNRGVGTNIDIYVSHRGDPNDDFVWETPVALGPGVNTVDGDQAPMYRQSAEDGAANLYFNRGLLASNSADIYVAAVTRDGETSGPAELVTELSLPNVNDAAVTVRTDGRELMFYSNRPGGLGLTDLWVSTRSNSHEPWSPPVNAGASLNSPFADVTPSISADGRTLIFASNRPGGFGGNDLYMATRTPSGN